MCYIGMIFACAAAAAATAASHSPAWYLGGAYHPPLPGRTNDGLLQAIGSANVHGGAAIDGEALTVALDVVQAWAVLLTLGFTLIIFFFLAFCVCSKKDDGYDEFEISHGITTVKILHDGGENGVSLIPRINGSGTLSLKATDETSEASSRYTLKRELPAIPTNTQESLQSKSERPISQHSSDLYASVSDPNQGASNVKLIGGVQVLPAGAIAPGGRAAVIKECVSSPESEHSDKGKKKKEKTEHPYSKVIHKDGKDTETNNYDDPKVITQDKRKKDVEVRYQSAPQKSEKRDDFVSSKPMYGQPFRDQSSKVGGATSPTALASVHSTFSPHSSTAATQSTLQGHSAVSPTQPIAHSNIPAALAISGRQPANEEMPYMTPPVLQPAREREQQERYSGDSQDLRGYTSISVREPLAALKARQSAEGGVAGRNSGTVGTGSVLRSGIPSAQGPEGEGYYMTVSDDSADEMYACIYEGARGNGSETYAQIEPRTTPSSAQPPASIQSPTNVPASPTQLSRSQEQSPPAPPSVDSLRHVVHSRQASASSATSTGMGSPVAEKRGTRSPLPPLPQGDISLYSPPDPPILSSQSIPKSPPKAISHFIEKSAPRSLEDMYAKVIKKPPGHSRGSSAGGENEGGHSNSRRGSGDVGVNRWTSATSPLSPKSTNDMAHSLIETRTHDVSGVNRAKSCDISGSWNGLGKEGKSPLQLNRTSGNYESIPSQGGSLYSGSDPGYETVKNGEPPYASVGPSENYPGYETVRGSDMDSEPGYETLKHKETEPGYETVAELTSKTRIPTSEPGYESLINIGISASDFEPGYETVSSKEPSDPGYESVKEKSKLEYDPCYEELSHPRTSSETDPNYEQLKFTSSRRSSDGDNGYEVVQKQTVEGNYELVSDYETQEKISLDQEVFLPQVISAIPPVVPLYASVKKKESPKKEHVELPIAVNEQKNDNFNDVITGSLLNTADKIEEPSEIISIDKNDILSDIDDLLNDLTKPIVTPTSESNLVDFNDHDNVIVPSSPKAVTTMSNDKEVSWAEEMKILQDAPLSPESQESTEITKDENFQVLDSPEDVELPPPAEDNNELPQEPETADFDQSMKESEVKTPAETAFCSSLKEDSSFDSPQPFVSLTFTAASPPIGSPEVNNSPRSSASSAGSSKEDQGERRDSKEERVTELSEEVSDIVSAPPPPQFDELQCKSEKEEDLPLTNNVDDPLPPPPLPILDDDIATASPPPPPPPLPEEVCSTHDLPLPPISQEVEMTNENINGVSSTTDQLNSSLDAVSSYDQESSELPSSCSQGVENNSIVDSDMPPPPSFSLSEEEDASFRGSMNGSMTVTVNPMAAMEDRTPDAVSSPPVTSPTTVTVLPTSNGTPTPITAVSASSGESGSSGSTANGSGSVESVVTVDAKTGSDPATFVPTLTQAPTLQHSSSTSSSSSESKHSDPNEGITSV